MHDLAVAQHVDCRPHAHLALLGRQTSKLRQVDARAFACAMLPQVLASTMLKP